MLKIENLSVSIASMQILRDVSLQVPTGSMTGLIGRNGAGKTTVMKTVMGLLKAGRGSVRFESRDLLAKEDPTRGADEVERASHHDRLLRR